MIKIFTNILGTFALKGEKIVGRILFERSGVKEIAEKLFRIEGGSLCEEEEELIKQLGEREIEVDDPPRFSGYFTEINFRKGKIFPTPREIGSLVGVKKADILELTRKVSLELSKIKLRIPQQDRILIQSINALDELEEVINLLVEHLKELYSLNFPELVTLVKEPREYVEVVLGKKQAGMEEAKRKSRGMEFSAEDEKAARESARGILGLYFTRGYLEEYIEKKAMQVAPNTTELIGPLLTARLISLPGGMKKLALMPSSTIQILGAEKAFFRFLKRKNKPPKHGIIFQMPEIRSAKKKVRGKLSRTLASKIAITSKMDFQGGEFIGDKLRKSFLERVEKLKER